MVEIAAKPHGPYSLALSARLASDATRRFRDGVFTARYADAVAHAWQSPDGTVTIRSDSVAAAEKLRWVLALDDDHSEFLRRFRSDPLIGRATVHLRGLRPVRTATVAQALLRAVCGQLIDSKTARAHERRVIRVALAARRCDGLCEPPTTAALGALAPFELRRLGLHERRGAALVRVCRSLELERLHDVPTEAVVAPDRARARPRPVVGRRRLPRGARPLRARPRRRPRPRQVPPRRCAAGRGRDVGDGRAARAVRRVGRPRERLPPHGLRPRPGPAAGCARRLAARRRRGSRRPSRRSARRADAAPASGRRCSRPRTPDPW